MYGRVFAVAAVLIAWIAIVTRSQTQAPLATTPGSEQICQSRNGTNCNTCTRGHNSTLSFRCYWCQSTNSCGAVGVDTIIPISGIPCPTLRHNVATCTLDVLSIIIIIAVGCTVFVVLICCLCCCCCICCANRRRRMKIIEENRYSDEKDSIRQKSSERRAERKAKHEEIRRKYGLNTEDGEKDASYKRL